MAQHDYVIANGTGAAVRSDLNNALAAIVTQNSGATAPATTYAYQWWADTTTGLLKIRNAANNAWVTIGSLSTAGFGLLAAGDTLTAALGSASTPGITFTGDLNTGIYSPGADQVAISTNGTQRVTIDTAATTSTLPVVHPLGAVGTPSITFTGDLNTGIWSPAADTIAFSEGGVEAMRIDSSGRVGIGTTPGATLDVAPDANRNFQVQGKSGTTYGIEIKNGTANSGGEFHVTAASSGGVVFNRGSTEMGRFDNSSRLLVGTSTARSVAGQTHLVQLETVGSSPFGGISAINNANNNNGSYLVLGKSRGTSVGSNTIVQNGDQLGGVFFAAADGNGVNAYSGAITCEIDAAPSAGDTPGRLVFSTCSDGSASPTERLKINAAGYLYSVPTYNNAQSLSANVFVFSDGSFGRATSSIKYKKDVETIDNYYSDLLLNCRPVWYRAINSNQDPDWGYWGFIAEEVAEIDPRLVHWKTIEVTYDENGSAVETPLENPEPEGVQYDRFVPHLINLIKRQKEQIEAMEARLTALEAA